VTARASLWRWLGAASGLAVTALFLALAIRAVEWADVLRAFREAQFFPWAPLSLAMYVGGLFIRGERCRLLVARQRAIPVVVATNIVVLGNGINNMLPGRVGEFARAAALAGRTGSSYVQALTVVFLERVLDGLAIVLAFVIAALVLPVPTWLQSAAALAAVIFLVALGGIALATVFPSLPPLLAGRWLRRLPARVREFALRFALDTVRAVAPLRDPVLTVRIAALSVAIWLVDALAFLLLFPAFSIPFSPLGALLVMAATNLGVLLPSSPSFAGPFHYFCMQALAALGVAAGAALSYAISLHVLIHVPFIFWAMALIAAWGIRIARAAPLDACPDALPAAVAASGFAAAAVGQYSTVHATRDGALPLLRALVDSLAPRDRAGLPPAVHADAVEATARFVQDQLAALSAWLALQVRVALWGFQAYAVVRHGSRFSKLGSTQRVEMVDAWSSAPFAPARQLMRLLRSFTFLAYFEQPAVLAALGAAPAAAKRPIAVEHAVALR
jgi:uncharacterized protein (TIRG00374 family)